MGIDGHGREKERLNSKRSDSLVIYKLRYPVLAFELISIKGACYKVTTIY
jgi:hypothetical protein